LPGHIEVFPGAYSKLEAGIFPAGGFARPEPRYSPLKTLVGPSRRLSESFLSDARPGGG